MAKGDWDAPWARSLAVFFNGRTLPGTDSRGQPFTDDSFLILLNAHDDALDFVLPDEQWGESWVVEVDTSAPAAEGEPCPGPAYSLQARSLAVLRSPQHA